MNNSKLISKEVNGLETVYTLVPGTKLSEVMDELPHGIINKNYTGIGGTTLELDCNRNSIVVEPLKETAWAKAQKPSRSNKYKVHYFGTKSYVQTKISKKISTLSTKEINLEELSNNLNEYIKACNEQNAPIKICTVTDQLEKLCGLLKESHTDLYDTFHLLLDEVDYMQASSSYREVMFKCIDIYKEHLPHKRSLLSATIQKFHDPIISAEPVTTIKVQDYKKTNLDVFKSILINEGIIELIKQRLSTNPNEKIVVALNQVTTCVEIAKALVNQGVLEKSKITILCSQSRANDVKEFTPEITTIGTLPSLLTFITSAYFVGYDIDDAYHNIVVCDGNSIPLTLHPSTVYQVCGRCRSTNGLLSNNLLLRGIFNASEYIKKYTSEELTANSTIATGITALLNLVAAQPTEYAHRFKEHLNKSIFNTSDFYFNVFRKASDGNDTAEIAYFKIDEIILNQETRDLCTDTDSYSKSLGEWFNVKQHILDIEPSEVECKSLKDALTHTLKLIRQIPADTKPKDYTKNILNSISTTKPIKASIKNLISTYAFIEKDTLFSPNKVLKEAETIILTEKQPNARLEDFKLYLEYKKLKSLGSSVAVTSIELAYSINSSSPTSDVMDINKKLKDSLSKADSSTPLEKRFISEICKKKMQKKLHTLFCNVTSKNSNSVKTITFTAGEKYDILAKTPAQQRI
jgi:hypothetical protein